MEKGTDEKKGGEVLIQFRPFSSSKPRFSMDHVEQFKKKFMNLSRGHRGRIERPNPSSVPDTADAIQKTFCWESVPTPPSDPDYHRCRGHGGKFDNPNPSIINAVPNSTDAIQETY